MRLTKLAVAITVCVVLLQQANAQEDQQQDRAAIIQGAITGTISCNDPRILTLIPNVPVGLSQKDANFISCVARRLMMGNRIALPPGRGNTWQFRMVHSTLINSVTQWLPPGRLAVMAFDSMAAFVNYDPDEEAFVIAHEIGHVQDWANCQALKAQKLNQALIWKQHALTRGQQTCEEDADFYGLQFMWGAGFNPYAAGAVMGRLEMYAADQTRGIGAIINNFVSDHPISPERTKRLRDEMIQLCSRPGTVCRP
jgi:Zn-dependent protease with chaperone function